MVIVDLILRSRDLVAFHTDAGVFPRSIAVQSFDWTFSFHFVSGTAIFQAVLFVAHAFFALLMIVGYRTRISTLITLVLTVSVQARNPYIVQGSDILLTVLLFWSLFLPLGARFSFDEALNETPPQSNHYVSVASAALLVQAMSVYFFSAVAKDFYPPWNSDFTGVLYALRGGSYGTFLGQWFGQFETLAHWLTHYVMHLEFYGPLLMFLSAYFAPARLFMQFLFITMHLGFLLFLGVGQFPWISITSLLAFTPSAFWDELAKRVRTPERLTIRIYYDKPCNFCKKISLILRSFLLFPDTPLEPAQKIPKIHAILEKHNSWVVLDAAGTAHVRWDAMITLFRHSPVFSWLTPLLTLDPMRNLGERFYTWVAANRERLAEKTAPWLVMRQQSTEASWLTSNLIFVFLVIMLLGNITYINNKPMPPPVLERAMRSLNLYQPWLMFMHTPAFREWYLARGVTKAGEIVDVFRNKKGEPSLSVPKYATEGGWDPNFRWRKFVTNMWYPSLRFLRPYYVAYLCRSWNSAHEGKDQLQKITVVYTVGGGPLNLPVEQQPWQEFQCESTNPNPGTTN